jgi:hypothetical protein
LLSLAVSSGRLADDSQPARFPVKVEIFENVPAATSLNLDKLQPVETYAETAFAFVRFPTKFSQNALALDRPNPFFIRATQNRALPAGEYEFRLRARGTAVFLVDGKELMTTEAQSGNTAGHDDVPPEPVRYGNIRPAPYPHQEEICTFRISEGAHQFVLIAQIGGRGLNPSPGELSVSIRTAKSPHSAPAPNNGKPETAAVENLPRLLGNDDAPFLTDQSWEQFAAGQKERHRVRDIEHRRAVSAEVVGAWEKYHREVRAKISASPGPALPAVARNAPVLNDIDRFIDAKLASAKLAPTALTSDLEFLRRVSLDVTGRIPTADEVRMFLKEPAKSRRQKAIDRLLSSPEWADHWVSYWQDVLAENPGILKPDLNNSGPFRWWLHQCFEDNIPFDRMAAELIQMEGSEYLGAPGAFKKASLNDAPMAAKADIISQAFLGEKLSCARCHDAPFHPWTQKNTFALGAMLEGKPISVPLSSTVPMVDGFRKPRVEVTLHPGQPVDPQWPFTKLLGTDSCCEMELPSPPISGPVKTRNKVAALMTSPANDRFAKVLVNRVWKRYLGAGFVEPAEDWYEAKSSHAELLNFLAREFVLSGYDLKALSRLILSSHVYQRQAVPSVMAKSDAEQRLFTGPIRRRMSAEQLTDSLFLAVGKEFDCEELNLNPAGNRPLSEFNDLGKPRRAWEFTALSNERDRPALALPRAQSMIDVLCAFGWRQSRQTPITTREDSPSPMQTLLLANGVVGTRIVRLSDDSALTELALTAKTADDLVNETFVRILSRAASREELRAGEDLLRASFSGRRTHAAVQAKAGGETDQRVTWGNHLSSEATLIRMQEERNLRMGDAPTARLTAPFREAFEDLIWSLVNSPEFTLVP